MKRGQREDVENNEFAADVGESQDMLAGYSQEIEQGWYIIGSRFVQLTHPCSLHLHAQFCMGEKLNKTTSNNVPTGTGYTQDSESILSLRGRRSSNVQGEENKEEEVFGGYL